MSNAQLDSQGRLILGPDGSPPSRAKIQITPDVDDTNGIAIQIKAGSPASNDRAGITLGDYSIVQDTAKTGSKDVGIVDASGNLITRLVTSAGARFSYGAEEIFKSTIPLIVLPSGSFGNNGALTSGTANPVAYTDSYVWCPAGSIVAASVAGWYYAHWSDTTHATVYNNTWDGTTSPACVASPTAFAVTGPGAFTGPTAEAAYLPIAIPASAISDILHIRIDTGHTNNANAKTLKSRMTNVSGTTFHTFALASNAGTEIKADLMNTGETNKQRVSGWMIGDATAALHSKAIAAETQNVAWALALTITKATATDVVVFETIQIDRDRA